MITTQLLEKRQPVAVKTPVYRLMRGQRVLHNGTTYKVARVVPRFHSHQWLACPPTAARL